MTVDQYEEIRSESNRFAVLVGHEMLDFERVIATHADYLVVEKSGDAGQIADAADPRHDLKTCRVVIVDVPEMRYFLKMLLAVEPSCMVVGEAGSGAEAIAVVEAMQPEVVVLDLEKPTMDGWQTLPELRRVAPTANLIVFSSPNVDARLEKRLTNMGADRYVRKGGDPTIIMGAIRDVVLSGDAGDSPDGRDDR